VLKCIDNVYAANTIEWSCKSGKLSQQVGFKYRFDC